MKGGFDLAGCKKSIQFASIFFGLTPAAVSFSITSSSYFRWIIF